MLAHYKNSKVSMNDFEPVYLNLFEAILTPPASITSALGNPATILLEQVKKISGLEIDKNPGVVEQHYKTQKRRFAGAKPETSTLDIVVDFEVNVSDANSMYVYDILRRWSNLIFDPQTATGTLKSKYRGSGVFVMHNREGDIFKKVEIAKMWPMTPITALELDYQSTEIYTISMTFAAELVNDTWN